MCNMYVGMFFSIYALKLKYILAKILEFQLKQQIKLLINFINV